MILNPYMHSAPNALLIDLTSWWSLDEASGDALDAHGTNDLTDTNTVGSAAGKVGNARDFEAGSSEYFTKASNSDFQIADTDTSYEFTCWINQESTGTQQVITKRNGAGVNGSLEYMLRMDAGVPTVYWGYDPGFDSLAHAGGALSTATWYFITWGYNAATNKFFVGVDDGALTESGAVTTQNVARTNPFQIGGSGTEYFDGLIDEVGFWKRVLTAGERTWLYNSGNGRAYTDI